MILSSFVGSFYPTLSGYLTQNIIALKQKGDIIRAKKDDKGEQGEINNDFGSITYNIGSNSLNAKQR